MKVGLLRSSRILVACVVLAGCAKPVSTGADHSNPSAIYTGPITESIVYRNAGITLEVPSSTEVGVGWSEAYLSNCKSGDAICALDQQPTIMLAEATVEGTGEAQPDGSIKPLVKNTLAYVILYDDVPCAPSGPGRADGASTSAPTIVLCKILNLIDANSGKVLFSVQGPSL